MKSIMVLILLLAFNGSIFSQTKQDSIKIIELEKKIQNITESINDAGSNFQTAAIISIVGSVTSIAAALLTYDKNTKTFNDISYAPAIIGTLTAIVVYLVGTGDMKHAGK